MLKIAVAELEQLVQLIKKTSIDVHATIRQDAQAVVVTYQHADGSMVEARIYDEGQRTMAKIISSEKLLEAVKRLKA